jgi:hypothetical protein
MLSVTAALCQQVINWMLTLADGSAAGVPGRGFKSAGFESFERMWTGQQVCINTLPICSCVVALLFLITR